MRKPKLASIAGKGMKKVKSDPCIAGDTLMSPHRKDSERMERRLALRGECIEGYGERLENLVGQTLRFFKVMPPQAA
ncbi:MAG TPA: hypothetical protein VEB86_14745 [Chryseosolibacter sp.]|nr:hypothetical protein [Chryseosolibacter sp.]